METSGYLSPAYAASLEETGSPLKLPGCGGWVIKRPIEGQGLTDAMGCYPLFLCEDWSLLQEDLMEIGKGLVSIALVADPFGSYKPLQLEKCFPDVMIPFKEAFVVDLEQDMGVYVGSHHQRNARNALRSVLVEKAVDPTQHLKEWTRLYAYLVDRHSITGIPAFSEKAFRKQLAAPGLVALRAIHRDETVGMTLWYKTGSTGYYHLGAYSETGYKLRASFALFWTALEVFSEAGLKWLYLGSGAGLKENQNDGLSRFKKGWSNATRPLFFCGRIFDDENYSKIVREKRKKETSYFPAYRQGEFG